MNRVLSNILKELSTLDELYIELNNSITTNVSINKKNPVEESMFEIKKNTKSIKNTICDTIIPNLYNKK